jgi:hypothetical protein
MATDKKEPKPVQNAPAPTAATPAAEVKKIPVKTVKKGVKGNALR